MERHAAIGGTEEQATLLQGTSADPQQQVIQQPVLTEEEMALARRERLVNLAIKEAEAAERRANLKTFYMHAIEEERETLRRLGAYNEAIHAQWFRDRALSTVQTDISRLLTDGSASTQDGLTLWTVAHRVQAIGLRFRATQPGERDRAQALGMAVAAEYRRRFNQDPPKIFRGDAPIVVNGSNVAPNGYSNHDCDVWLDEFVRTWIANDNPPVPGAPGPVRRHARRARATTAGNGGTHAPKQGELNSFFRRHGR